MNASKIGDNPQNFKVRTLFQQETREMQKTGVWKEGCPIRLSRLRVVEFSYWHLEKNDENSWSFNGKQKHDGKIIVLDVAADYVRKIFKNLYEMKFPIHKACPMECYGGDDEQSMTDNNSSSFNFREITGGGLPSLHAYGLAIDINPIPNPYISFLEDKDIQGSGNAQVLPLSGCSYLNRNNPRPGMIESYGDMVINTFKDYGFPIWGGKWNTPIDWQHFQTSRAVAQLLAAMSLEDAIIFFGLYVKDPDLLNKADPKNNIFVSLYSDHREKFMECLNNNSNFLKMNAEDAHNLI